MTGGPAFTPSQTSGPYVSLVLTSVEEWAGSPAQPTVRLVGQVFDGAGRGVDDAVLEFWHVDRDGTCPAGAYRRVATDADGRFDVDVADPRADQDGAAGRPHVGVLIMAGGLNRHLLTRAYLPFDDDGDGADDPVLAVVAPERRATLIARDEGDHLRFDVRLQGDDETVFLDG